MIIADRAMARQNRLHHAFAIDRMFEGEAKVLVVKGRCVAAHGKAVMRRSGDLEKLHRLVSLQQRHRLGVKPVDQMHAVAEQRIQSRVAVIYSDRFN